MTCELFQEKKKHKKKTQILEKKKTVTYAQKKKSYFQGLLQRRARKLLSKPIYRFFIYIYLQKAPSFFFFVLAFWRTIFFQALFQPVFALLLFILLKSILSEPSFFRRVTFSVGSSSYVSIFVKNRIQFVLY